jgi:uncharacterized membrane protein YkvA (DUF1232 family)
MGNDYASTDGIPNKKGYYHQLRKQIKKYLGSKEGQENKFADYLLLVPDIFHLLCALEMDKEVPVADKAVLAAVVVYFVAPFDLIPEGLFGPLGYADDLVIAVYALNRMLNHVDKELIERHWAGQGDILEKIQSILAVADEMVGSGRWKSIKDAFNKRNAV